MGDQNSLEGSFQDNELRNKAPRMRSAAYPSYTILFCVSMTQKIYQSFGSSIFCSREQIAKELDSSVGHIQTQLSSAVQYGLLEMKSKEGYKPTPLFIQIYKPLGNDREAGLLKCLYNPPLYEKLFNEFQDGFIPPLSGLSTILFRNHSIAEAASESAASIFIQNLIDLEILGEDNHLKSHGISETPKAGMVSFEDYTNDKSADIIEANPKTEPKQLPNSGTIVQLLPNEPLPLTYIIALKDNREAHLAIPKGHDDKDLNKIIRFVKGLKMEDD